MLVNTMAEGSSLGHKEGHRAMLSYVSGRLGEWGPNPDGECSMEQRQWQRRGLAYVVHNIFSLLNSDVTG